MSKNKNILAVIALVLALVSIAAAAYAVVQTGRISDLEAQLAALTARNEPQSSDSADQETLPIDPIRSTDLSAAVWTDGQGADITLTLEPAVYTEGDSARFRVRLGQELAADLVCAWDGSAFTATAQLPAANGYSYACTLIRADGSEEVLSLASPENPVATELVYLDDALRSYCNLIPEDWTAAGGNLTITACHIQVQLPQLSLSDSLNIRQAALVLRQGEEVVATQPVTLNPGEASRSFEATAEHITFSLPELAEGDVVELWLDVTLSDGQVLYACGASWCVTGGRFHMAVG